jgi:tetratricopeptide (TPR) repeat protein
MGSKYLLGTLLSTALLGCGLIFPSKTGEEDTEMVKFAEARQRGAIYYDGGDYIRAAAQYKKALDIKPGHVMTQLGYAYSLKNTEYPPNLNQALKVLTQELGEQPDHSLEVKRTYGIADCYRNLAVYFRRRAEQREGKGLLQQAAEDRKLSIENAQKGIAQYEKVFALDQKLAARHIAAPFRASASLKPMAHLGIGVCCIVLGDRKNPAPLERAVEEINSYAQTAANARTFWEKQRGKIMETDPMADAQIPNMGEMLGGAEERARFDERIKSTITKEALVRQALVETYMYLERFNDAIEQCTRIIELNEAQSQGNAYFFRARAYALLKPPQYERAIEDMTEFRKRQDLTRLTQEVIRVNQLIKTYERKLREQKKQEEADRDAG